MYNGEVIAHAVADILLLDSLSSEYGVKLAKETLTTEDMHALLLCKLTHTAAQIPCCGDFIRGAVFIMLVRKYNEVAELEKLGKMEQSGE